MTEGGGEPREGGREGEEDAYFIHGGAFEKKKKRRRRGRGGGDPAFTFWLINGSFFDYRLLCDAYLASLGFHPPLSLLSHAWLVIQRPVKKSSAR